MEIKLSNLVLDVQRVNNWTRSFNNYEKTFMFHIALCILVLTIHIVRFLSLSFS